MRIRKAVITAAGKGQRTLPLQTLIDSDGEEKSVLQIFVEQALAAGVEEVGVVVRPGDDTRYSEAVAVSVRGRLHFVAQPEPLGYAHALYCARDFVGAEAFLHLVGDHLCVPAGPEPCALRIVQIAAAENCAVSTVQATREGLLPHYGTVGGRRVSGRQDLYRVETVIEKPTPTEAEQRLHSPGMRAGYYLCFFGMHVLTPAVMDLVREMLASEPSVTLSAALAEFARREQYLALLSSDRRYDLGARYGLLTAQLALALHGRDREQVLADLVELLATRELAAAR